MAEILVKAIDSTNPDPEKDRRGCYKRGMPVIVAEDGHTWGLEERLPRFVVIKVPMISIDAVLKYVSQQFGTGPDPDNPPVFRRRLWQIQWSSLPASARNKLQNTGMLTIKATAAYTGPYDYTWTQIKTYFKNLETGLTETTELS